MRHLTAAALAGLLTLGCGDDTTGAGGNTPAPSGVQAAIVDGNISLTWDTVPGATSYRVYMASEPGVRRSNLQQLVNNMYHPGLTDGFDHPPGLQTDLEYFLVVTAVGPDGESTESCEVRAIIGTAFATSC
jgi:fibronectin type 3 domain-containing protein